MNTANLNLYYIFFVVAGCGNISNAAQKLFISQPAISKAISRLEANLETTLFFRSSRGVKLTQEGELLYRQLENAFHSIEKGEEELKKSIQLGYGQLSIGVSTTLCKYVLLPRLPEFIKKNPYFKLSISCRSTNAAIQALETEELDIGLVGEPDKLNSLRFIPIREITDIFVTTNQYLHQLKLQGIHPTLENATLLLLDKDNITRQYIERYLFDNHLNAASVLEVSTMDLLIEFAAAGMGIACVISDFVQKELEAETLIQFPSPTPIPPRKIGIACKNRTTPTLPMQKFIDLFVPDRRDLK